MTENEAKAIKWIKRVRNDAVASLNHIEKNEPDASGPIQRSGRMLFLERKKTAETFIKGFEELEQYRELGTVEECREAMERRTPKTPNIWGDGCDDEGNMIYDMYDCPNCSESYELDYHNYKFCSECGQAIDRHGMSKFFREGQIHE